MTRIMGGCAQPDIVATKDGATRMLFVETPSSLRDNTEALKRAYVWLSAHEPDATVELVVVVPRRR